MRILFVASLLLFGFASGGAQTASPHELTIMIGKGELLHFERDVQRVVVAEPKIADAIVVSPREVMVNAKGVGKTTVVIWETGSGTAQYNVGVSPDTSEFDSFRKEFRDGFPDSNVS